MELKQNITAVIYPGEQHGYVAECVEISVVTQGDTLDEVVHHLQEAIALHLQEEDAAEFGLVAQPSVLITFEIQLEYA